MEIRKTENYLHDSPSPLTHAAQTHSGLFPGVVQSAKHQSKAASVCQQPPSLSFSNFWKPSSGTFSAAVEKNHSSVAAFTDTGAESRTIGVKCFQERKQ